MSSDFTPLALAALRTHLERTKADSEQLIERAERAIDEGDSDEITWSRIVIALDERAAVRREQGNYTQALHCQLAWLAMQLAEMRREQREREE